MNYKTLEELKDAFIKAGKDPETKVVLITGKGEKAFIGGADLNELVLVDPISGKEVSQRGQAIFGLIENLGKPTIAVVNGYAVGGGMELALACTMRISSPNAIFGLPEVSRGFVPGYGGTQRLPRLVGEGRAMEIILSAEPIDAQEAYRIGLVNKIFPQESLMDDARKFAQKFVRNGAIALRLAMDAIHRGLDLSLGKGLELESFVTGISMGTEDAKEGTRSFLEKRKPIFKDR